ncbi:MAG: aminodeoxychorismate synthase, component I [SAR86 cluster bacterium]|uniref:aminodeoxychorismate synthase n=1 Tax=SAR86 cluster bacterium TaxID=2030880 RepID=A0A2A5B3I3_9GAMM|nr:MAG: aminodeoxychorismate synthase, component I [SAR86 cluster bacterium]
MSLNTKPPTCFELAYNRDSSRLMRRLSLLEMPAFLDSSAYQGDSARYDILSAAPAANIKIESGHVIVSDPEFSVSSNTGIELDKLLSIIRQLKAKYLASADQHQALGVGLPFQGGIIGYLGYPELLGASTFNINEAFVGIYLWAVVVDHQQCSCRLVFHPVCSDSDRAQIHTLLHSDNTDSPASPYSASYSSPEPAFTLKSSFKNHLSRDEYRNAFNQIKQYIDAGDCYQVNLTQSFRAECSGNPLDAYLSLRNATQAPFSAYMNWQSGALLSLSPERFLSLRDNTVLTQPIKGTRPRSEDSNTDAQLASALVESEKDRAENLMIVDLLRNDLGRVCKTGSVKANQLFALQSFSNVHHMVSSISGELAQGLGAFELLASCFPGGSITGAPKLRAMEIIEQLEQASRRAYCGSVFYLSANGNMDSSITIRTLLWQQDHILCWAGGGIVADSECDAEYDECFDKINIIIKTLQK